jgi:hypothetical protein
MLLGKQTLFLNFRQRFLVTREITTVSEHIGTIARAPNTAPATKKTNSIITRGADC